MNCPHCSKPIDPELIIKTGSALLGSKGGAKTSKSKASSSRENGKKGGRPRKQPPAFQASR